MTDAWDGSIPSHKAIQHGIEVGEDLYSADGSLEMVSPK